MGNTKRYVCLMLKTLEIRRFEHKDEWQEAMALWRTKNIRYVPLKWHAGLKEYNQPEEVC